MNPRHRLILAAAALLLPVLGGSLSAAPPAPNGGTISVAFKTGDGEYSASMPAFMGATDDALATKGFTILDDPGHAAYLAELTLTRIEVGTGTAKVPHGSASVAPGIGGGAGAGITVPLSAGETRLVPLQRIRLDMRITKRGEDGIVWAGAAVTVRAAGTKKGADAVVAADLSNALLSSYPVSAGEVITVP